MAARRRARKREPPPLGRQVVSSQQASLLRRRGNTVWALRPSAEEEARQHAEARASHAAIVATLPNVRKRFHAITASLDAYDVLATMAVYLSGQPELDESDLPEVVWAPIELAAMLLAERPSAAALEATHEPVGPTTPDLFALLAPVIDVAAAELCGYYARPRGDTLTEIHERFVRRLLIVPMNETYEQACEQFFEVFSDPVIDTWLAAELGFSAREALALARAVAVLQVIEGIAPFMMGLEGTDTTGIGCAGSFTVDELADTAGTTRSAAAGFADCLAHPFGSPPVTLPSLTTPMRHHPLLRDDGRLFAPVPPMVPRVLRSIITAIANPKIPTPISGRQAVFDRLTSVRAAKLEQRAITAISGRLRADRAAVGVRFAVADRGRRLEGEIDGLVELDGTAIVVQAKSGSTRVDAVAAEPEEFRQVVRGILTEAMRQHDDARRLLTAPAAAARASVPLHTPVAGDVLPITVTLEDLSGCAPFSWQLREAGLATDGPLPWIAALPQLEVILDLVDLPAQFVHFLQRRAELNVVRLLQTTDETDIFLEYLHDRLAIVHVDPRHPDAPAAVLPPERFHALGRYLLARTAGERPPKPPRMRLHGGARELLERLDGDRPAGWLAASLAILDLPRQMERRFGAAYWRLVRGGEPNVFAVRSADDALLVVVRLPPGVAIDPADLDSRARREARSAGTSRWVAVALPARRGSPIVRVSVGERKVSAAASSAG